MALVAVGLVAVGVLRSEPAQAASSVPLPQTATWQWVYDYTGTGSVTPAVSIDTNKIYVGGVATPFVSTLAPDATGVVTSATRTSMITGVTAGQGWTNTQLSTIAVDSGGEDNARDPGMYVWNYASTNSVTAAGIGGATPPSPAANYFAVWRFEDGGTRPSKVYFIPDDGDSWAGGEIGQNTGYMYFTSTAGSLLQTNFQMQVFDPKTGNYNISGRIKPATTADTISGAPASDMALDAAGNAYIVVGTANAKNPASGATQLTSWLVKVTPGTPGNWTYSRVKPLFNDSNNDGVGDQAIASSNHYGMAFLNGQLYYAYGASNNADRVNPLTGAVRRLANTTTPLPYDYASGQAAAVVQGTVYNDANANGEVDEGEVGVEGQTVVLYDDQGKLIGTQETNTSGSYSFLLASSKATYYMRLAQPVINGANAVQTFGKGSTLYDLNGVEQQSLGGPGSGAAATPYVDPAPGVLGSNVALDQIAAYTKITINSGADLITQDFGASTVGSYGDAPTSYKSTIAQKGPQGIELPDGAGVRLGETRGKYADGSNTNNHETDDGVTLSVNGVQLPLANQILVSGKTYPLRAALGGDGAGAAKVNAWLAPANSNDTGVFPATPSASGTSSGTQAALSLTPTGTPSGGLAGTWLRVNASTNTAITSPDNASGQYAPPAGSTQSNSQPWVSDGEIEDYKVFQANAVVRIAVVNDIPGTFGFSGLTNVSPTAPSSTTDEIVVTTKDVLTYSGKAHAVVTVANDVVVTLSSVPDGEVLQSAKIVDTITGEVIADAVVDGNTFTIPAANFTSSGDVTLQLVYAANPVLTINQSEGMLNDPTKGRDLHFTLTSSVPLDPASVTAESFALTATPVDGMTIDPNRINERVVSIRQTDTEGKVFDVLVRVDDSAKVAVEVPVGMVSTPETNLRNTAPATWDDNEITYHNPLQVTPPQFTLVTGEPNGKNYSIVIAAGAPEPTADLIFASTVTQPPGSPTVSLGTSAPVIASRQTQTDPINVKAAAGDVDPNTETVIANTVTSEDTNYHGLVVPPVKPYLFSTDPTIRIEKRAWVAKEGTPFDQSSAEQIEATGQPAPKGVRLSDGQPVCFVYTVTNTSNDTGWETSLKDITVTDSDERLGTAGVIGTISELAEGESAKRFACAAIVPVDTTQSDVVPVDGE